MAAKTRLLTQRELDILARIETMMREKRLTWAAIARAAGVTPAAGRQWAGRRTMPREAIIHAIAQALEVPHQWLLTGDSDQERLTVQTRDEEALLTAFRALSLAEKKMVLASTKGVAAHITKK